MHKIVAGLIFLLLNTPLFAAVQSKTIEYQDDGVTLTGYLYWDDAVQGARPGVLVIHEWWGLNDNIRAMAERLAAEGYIVLAVDLFGGQAATNPEAARQLMLRAVENRDSVTSNIQQAYAFVSNTAGAPRIASLGWCFGGGWSLNTAMLFPTELDAAVIYYGRLVTDPTALEPIRARLLGVFGNEDQGIPPEVVDEFA